ncbi:hypothetical protein OBBRIDRAFT_111773 [Obba rivulosa]|uniref:Nephrocystin 3-like N-terminal domain-containing protein n=1 Tax=Obba rivulosa TaxID=1052685 RepID=A0A8E2DJP2_9APHY|nr:hypothetical protein OBBRIDRAFT_111773 [Obba rivulosa]
MSKRSGGPQTSTKTSPGRADHRSQDAVILNTIAVLNAAKDAVGNIQVPGLSEVFITAKFLLETLQLVRSTTQDVCDTVESIESLTVLLKSTIDKINEKTTTSDDEARKVIDEIEHSEDLKDRISGLQGALEGIKSSAKLLVHEHWYSRYWYARRDAKTLTDIRTKIATAKEQFKMRGDIDMHILIDRLAGDAHRSLEEARKTNTLLKVIDSREQQREHKEREREERETLKKLRRAPDALYKSARQSAKARIVSGTRERTLGTLLEWCKAPTQSQRVFILHAPPGTGKSIIMHEVARQLLETHLGATFFFQRDEDECCDPNRVIPTIVHQLARITELRPSIVKAVERYLDECGDEDQVLQGQRALLMDPLSQNFNKDTPIAILVDGLEGCSDKDPEALQMLLQLLFEVADRNPVVRLLISTSLEDRIKSALDSITTRDASLWLDLQNDVSPAEIQHDISLFIETELKRGMAGSDKFTLLRDRPDALTNLTNLSSGLFIFARVVVMCLTGDAVKAPGYYDALLNAKNATTSVHMQDKVDVVYKVVLHGTEGAHLSRGLLLR